MITKSRQVYQIRIQNREKISIFLSSETLGVWLSTAEGAKPLPFAYGGAEPLSTVK